MRGHPGMCNDIHQADLQILLQVVTELQSHNTRQRSKTISCRRISPWLIRNWINSRNLCPNSGNFLFVDAIRFHQFNDSVQGIAVPAFPERQCHIILLNPIMDFSTHWWIITGNDREIDSPTRQFLVIQHKIKCVQHKGQIDNVRCKALERRAAEQDCVNILSINDK